MEERSAAKKKMVIEEKKKESDKQADKSRRDQREKDDKIEVSKKDLTQEYDGDDETQGTTGGASDFSDSFHPKEYNLTSVQESSSQSLTTKALDEPGEREAGESTKESDEKLEGDLTKQVTEDHVDEKGAGEIDEDEDLGGKNAKSRQVEELVEEDMASIQ